MRSSQPRNNRLPIENARRSDPVSSQLQQVRHKLLQPVDSQTGSMSSATRSPPSWRRLAVSAVRARPLPPAAPTCRSARSAAMLSPTAFNSLKPCRDAASSCASVYRLLHSAVAAALRGGEAQT